MITRQPPILRSTYPENIIRDMVKLYDMPITMKEDPCYMSFYDEMCREINDIAFGVSKLSEDQIHGLEFEIENMLTKREKGFLLERYQEKKPYGEMVKTHPDLSRARLLQITHRALMVLYRPNSISHIIMGYQWIEDKRKEMNVNPLTISDLGVPRNAYYALIRKIGDTGDSLDNLVKMIETNMFDFQKTRNIGVKSAERIISCLIQNHLLTKSLEEYMEEFNHCCVQARRIEKEGNINEV